MNGAFSRIMAAFAILTLTAAPALADSWNVGNSITYTLTSAVWTPYGSGGLFTLTNVNTGAVTQSFCLELNEHIYQKDVIAGIDDYASLGGRGGGSPDYISSSTDWLYAQFANGNVSYSNTQALQIAFWILEDEVSKTEAGNWFNAGLLSIANEYVSVALNHSTGSYGTKVLNLQTADSNAPHQSQLFRPVPEPATMLLLALGIAGVAGVKRKFEG